MIRKLLWLVLFAVGFTVNPAFAVQWKTNGTGQPGGPPVCYPTLCPDPYTAMQEDINYCTNHGSTGLYGHPCHYVDGTLHQAVQGETFCCGGNWQYKFTVEQSNNNNLWAEVIPVFGQTSNFNPQTTQVVQYTSDPSFTNDIVPFNANGPVLNIVVESVPVLGASGQETFTNITGVTATYQLGGSVGGFVHSSGTDGEGYGTDRWVLQTNSATMGANINLSITGNISPGGSDPFSHYKVTMYQMPRYAVQQWTPTVYFGSNQLPFTNYTVTYADYWQDTDNGSPNASGKLMHAEVYLSLTSKGSANATDAFSIGGLPCTSATNAGGGTMLAGYNFGTTITQTPTVEVSGTQAYFLHWTGTGLSTIKYSDVQNNTVVATSFTYLCQ